jgi:hypothetical protein
VCAEAERQMHDKLALSHGMARSVKLETLEDRVDGVIDEMRGVPAHMQQTGRLGMTQREITRRMGQLLALRANLNLHRDALLDRPDVYWEEPRLVRAARCMWHKLMRVSVVGVCVCDGCVQEALFQKMSRNLEARCLTSAMSLVSVDSCRTLFACTPSYDDRALSLRNTAYPCRLVYLF